MVITTADPPELPFTIPYSSTAFKWPPITFATSSSQYNQEQAAATPTSSSGYSSPTGPQFFDKGNQNIWEELAAGARIAIVIVIVAIVLIVLALAYFCCGCCGGRRCGKRRRTPPEQQNRSDVPLSPMPAAERRGRPDERAIDGDLPPPQYEETVPHQHQRIAGGITHVREEEEGVISDGKTPLSEIPFEDVVLDHPVSAGSGSGSGSPSSAREFAMRHHGLGGDTRGHTNS
ncbi:hypothetical protein N431DRAFT_435344 [Stipitochalara longipes BDJ]|nr:hypothetical protein N431DRAFT_435344 [Stipitochalara longipes BDJ]